MIVTGERRWRAAVLAGLPDVTALVLGGAPSGGDRLAVQLTENALREGPSPADRARAYRTLMDHHGWSGRRLAEYLHLHHSTVTRALRLLELPADLFDAVESGHLAARSAAEIARLDDPDQRAALTERALAERLTYPEIVALVGDDASYQEGNEPPIPSKARVFTTSVGRVTIEVGPGDDIFALMTAVTEVARALQAELIAARATGVSPR